MNVALPGLIVDVEARIDKLERGLKRANTVQAASAREMERRARQSADRLRATYGAAGDGIADSLSKIATPFVGGFLGGFSAAAIGGVVKNIGQITRGIAQIGDEAKRAGLEVETFQQWKFVADQNRIGIDALIDGFKELSLRADEFIVTGKGSGAEAFARLGFSADELKKRLKDPSELMLEIINRLQGMDRAAQIRISDEILGGAGGERFVEMIGKGEAGLRATMDAAVEAGAVMDAELIAKAQELDAKFTALQATMGGFFKGLVVNVAEAAVELVDLRERLDNLFPNEGEGRATLGDELYDTLQRDRDAVDAQAENLRALQGQYMSLGEAARQASNEIAGASITISAWDYQAEGAALAQAATDMRDLADRFEAGTITAEQFTAQLAEVQAKAKAAFDALDEADRVNFGNAISEVSRLGGVIDVVITKAAALAQTVAAAAGITLGGTTGTPVDGSAARRRDDNASAANAQATDNFLASETAANAKTTERLALEREIASVRERASKSGAILSPGQAEAAAQAAIVADAARRDAGRADTGAGAGGGGGGGGDGYTGALADLQAETQALELQAATLIATAAGGRQYGDALEFAKTKAELLAKAQRDGISITPAVTAQIDEVARAYTVAGESADRAAEKLSNIKSAGERGAAAVGSIFEQVATGAKTAQQALAELLMEILRAQMTKMITSAATGAAAGPFAFLGGLLGFAEGGYTGQGGRLEPAGVVHRGEFVMSKTATDRLGPANLSALHQSALRGYSDGGLVSGVQKSMTATTARPMESGAPSIVINSPVTVNASGGTPEQNADLAKQVSREIEGSMRATIITEVQRQMRPGNMLNRGR